MGFLSDIGDAIGGAAKSVGSAVTSAPALIGGALGGIGGAQVGATWDLLNQNGGSDGTAGGFQPSGPAPAIPGYSAGSQGYAFTDPTQTQAAAAPVDQRGIDAYRNVALGDTSPWTRLQLQQADMQAHDQSNALAQQAGSQSQQAQDQIAMGGGLTSGASERAAGDSARNTLLGQQGIARNTAENKQNINIAGRNQQLDALSKLPGMDLQAASLKQDLNKFNTTAALQAANQKNIYGQNQADLANAEADRLQKYNMGKYAIDSNVYGSSELANQSAYDRNNRSLWDKIIGA